MGKPKKKSPGSLPGQTSGSIQRRSRKYKPHYTKKKKKNSLDQTAKKRKVRACCVHACPVLQGVASYWWGESREKSVDSGVLGSDMGTRRCENGLPIFPGENGLLLHEMSGCYFQQVASASRSGAGD